MSVLDQVRDLDPNDPGRWPMPFRLGAIGLIFIVAVVLLAYFLAWKPKKPELDAARAQEQQLLATLETKARKAANLDASEWLKDPSLDILETKGAGDGGSDFTLNAVQENPQVAANPDDQVAAAPKRAGVRK